jgi:hypothetical protein
LAQDNRRRRVQRGSTPRIVEVGLFWALESPTLKAAKQQLFYFFLAEFGVGVAVTNSFMLLCGYAALTEFEKF